MRSLLVTGPNRQRQDEPVQVGESVYVFLVCNSHVKVRWTVYIVRMGERIVGANSAAWRSRVWRGVASARRLGVALAEPVARHQPALRPVDSPL